MTAPLRWALREPEPEDLPYILQTWWGEQGRKPQWQEFQSLALALLEELPVLVAHDAEDRDAIWGFHVPGHVTYVRRFVRGIGVEEALSSARNDQET